MLPLETQPDETSTAAEARPEAAMPPWQFSLREAFWFTTAAAGAAALAAVKGAGSLAMSVGLLLAWLNTRGRLAPVQTRTARPKVFYVAWALLAASLFLPAMKGCNNTVIYGWQTAYMCAATETEGIVEFVANRRAPDPPTWSELGTLAWVTLMNLANLLAVVSLFWLWRLQRGQGEWLGVALALAVIGVWAVPLQDPTNTLVGCYVWCAGFAVLLSAHRLNVRTFGVMVALAAVFILCSDPK